MGLYISAPERKEPFSANAAGYTFPGKPLVEATGDLGNFQVLSGVRGVEPMIVYMQQAEGLVRKVLESYPCDSSSEQRDLNILAVPDIDNKAVAFGEGILNHSPGRLFCLKLFSQG